MQASAEHWPCQAGLFRYTWIGEGCETPAQALHSVLAAGFARPRICVKQTVPVMCQVKYVLIPPSCLITQ